MTCPTIPFLGRVIITLIAATVGVASATRAAIDGPVIYSDDQTAASTIYDRDPSYRPAYLVYVDKQRTVDEAKKLVDDLGLTEHLRQYKTRVYVLGPANGVAYDAAADLTVYQNFLHTHRSSNLKIIAIGAGATFVNSVISKHAFSVAGILTYGGSIDPGSVSNMPVPAYVHSSDVTVARQYMRTVFSRNYRLYMTLIESQGSIRITTPILGNSSRI